MSEDQKHLTDDDYVLVDGAAWLTVGKFSVRVHTTDEGVAVDIYALGHEFPDSLAGTYAYTSDAEEALAEAEQSEEPKA